MLLLLFVFCALVPKTSLARNPIHYRAEESISDLRTGEITLRTNVIAWGEDFRLHAATGTYRIDPEEILLGGGVVGTWRGDSAWCSRARAEAQGSVIELEGSVHLRQSDGAGLWCARLLYRDANGLATMTGPVMLEDSSATYRARSDWGWYVKEEQTMHLARQCTLFVNSPGSPPLRVASDTTVLCQSSGKVTARGHVAILGDDVSGTCDVVEFFQDEERIVLTGYPALEGRSIRCTADRMVLQRKAGELRQVVLEGNAWAARTGDAPADSSRWDQTWGTRMVVWLTSGDPTTLLVTGDARAHHRVRDEEDTELGQNEAWGDSITLGVSDGALTSIRIAGRARGTYRPWDSKSGLPGDDLEYKATTLEYGEESGILLMEGLGELVSGSAKLTADTIKLSPATREMVALGDAILRDGTQEIKGQVMTFDVDRRQGVVRNGHTEFEKAFCLGKRVARIDDTRLDISEGEFTTCDSEHPHFFISSPKMRVELDNKVVARSLVLRIHDVPIFYLPYWIFPIRRDRHSGFLMPSFSVRNILGLEGSRAGVSDIGYYFVLGDYADAEVSLDWREGLGWTLNGDVNYALRYRIPRGSLNASYARREKEAAWRIQESHEQLLPRGWRLTANINATSSKPFIDQETWDEEDRLDQQAGLRSDVSLAKSLRGWSLRASLRRDQLWNTALTESTSTTTQTITSVLPEVAVSRPSKRLFPASGLKAPWYSELYASLSTSFRNRLVESDGDGHTKETATGTVHGLQLSWQLPKVLRKFNLSPRASYHETWIHRGTVPAEGDRLTNDRYGVLHDVGIAASTKLYGLWQPPVPGIVAVRHVVSPSITFSYTPDWFLRGWDFSTGRFSEGDGTTYAASGFGSSYAKSRRLAFALGNVFQVKTRKGDSIVKNDNLANLTFSTGYDLEKREAGDDPWSPLSTALTFSPGRAVSWNLSATHDPNSALGFVSMTSTVRAGIGGGWNRPPMIGPDSQQLESFRGTWRIEAVHSYSHRRGMHDEPQTLQVTLNLTPTRGWNARAWVNYDLTTREASNKSLTLTRDLHCWQADFSWYQAANQWHYLFKVFVKAYPQSLFVKHEEKGY